MGCKDSTGDPMDLIYLVDFLVDIYDVGRVICCKL